MTSSAGELLAGAAEARRHLEAARDVLARLDAVGILRGDVLLEQYRQAMLELPR